MLILKEKPTLKDFQQYVDEMDVERNFNKENVIQKCLMLGEEVGELFKAIRKQDGIKIDPNSHIKSIEDEVADVFIFLCAIANRCNVDMESAFRAKEEINKERV